MIYYFSGTGNSKWVSEKIGNSLNEKVENLAKIENFSELENEKYIGIIFPVYAFSVPQIIREFLNKLKQELDKNADKDRYIFAIITCAGEPAAIANVLNEIMEFDFIASIRMPNNDIFHVSASNKIDAIKTIEKAENRIEAIIKNINNKEKIIDVKNGILPELKTMLGKKANKFLINRTKPFYADDKCTTCYLCERVCPVNSIKIVEGKPKWYNKCSLCTSCINRCPREAIQYGKGTINRNRYYFEKYIKIDNK